MGLAAERRNNSICATPRAKCILIRPQDQPTLDRQNSQFLGITTCALHNAMVLQENLRFLKIGLQSLLSQCLLVLRSSVPPVPRSLWSFAFVLCVSFGQMLQSRGQNGTKHSYSFSVPSCSHFEGDQFFYEGDFLLRGLAFCSEMEAVLCTVVVSGC